MLGRHDALTGIFRITQLFLSHSYIKSHMVDISKVYFESGMLKEQGRAMGCSANSRVGMVREINWRTGMIQ